MASKYDVKVVEVPDGATQSQVETALKQQGANGWKLETLVSIGTRYFAILYKILVQ
jgi:hypothetical protein